MRITYPKSGSIRETVERASEDAGHFDDVQRAALRHLLDNLDALPFTAHAASGSRCWRFGAIPQGRWAAAQGHTRMPFIIRTYNADTIEMEYPSLSNQYPAEDFLPAEFS